MLSDDASPIARYTRAAAIRDGLLADVSHVAVRVGIRCPVALTRAAADLVMTGHLWDALVVLAFALYRSTDCETRFAVYIGDRFHALQAVRRPGDDGEPAIIVMLPDEPGL